MATVPILVFPYWKKEFHVHVNASSVTLGIVLTQPGEGAINHPIAFCSTKLSTTEKNYTMKEREGLSMIYALQKFRSYLLGGHFKMYIGSFDAEIPGQQANVGGEYLLMAPPISRI